MTESTLTREDKSCAPLYAVGGLFGARCLRDKG